MYLLWLNSLPFHFTGKQNTTRLRSVYNLTQDVKWVMQAREIPGNKTLGEGDREKIIIQSARGRYSLCVLKKALRGKNALWEALPYNAIFALIPSPPRSPSPTPWCKPFNVPWVISILLVSITLIRNVADLNAACYRPIVVWGLSMGWGPLL